MIILYEYIIYYGFKIVVLEFQFIINTKLINWHFDLCTLTKKSIFDDGDLIVTRLLRKNNIAIGTRSKIYRYEPEKFILIPPKIIFQPLSKNNYIVFHR